MMNRLTVLIALAVHGALPPVLAQTISTEAWYAATDPSGRQVVEIKCGSNFFDPREVVVRKDRPVRLTVESVGDLPQSFGFSESGFPGRVPIAAGASVVEFVPKARGRSAISCEPLGAPPDGPEMRGRKRGLLTVID